MSNMTGSVRRARKVDPNGNIYYDRGVSDIIFDPVRGTSVKKDIDELRGQMLTAMKFIEANPKGMDGMSAYDLAVKHGYEGTEEEWIAANCGQDGEDGLNAYEVACIYGGFVGTVDEWLKSLVGERGVDGRSTYEVAVDNGYEGTEEEWCASLNTTPISDEEILEIFNRVVEEAESIDVDYDNITQSINIINNKIEAMDQAMQNMVVDINTDTDAGTLTFIRHNGDNVTRTMYTFITEDDIDDVVKDYLSKGDSVSGEDQTYKWVNGESVLVDQ